MFIGGFSHTIDKKGRVVLPARFREVIKEKYIESFVIIKWFNDCLCLYPLKEWKAFEQQLNALPKDDKSRRVTRLIYESADDILIDKQGRIFLPNDLREFAGIEKDVVILGHSNRVEIWSKKRWEEYSKINDKPFEEVTQKLSELGV